jgi:hypothetical protein
VNNRAQSLFPGAFVSRGPQARAFVEKGGARKVLLTMRARAAASYQLIKSSGLCLS